MIQLAQNLVFFLTRAFDLERFLDSVKRALGTTRFWFSDRFGGGRLL